MDKIKILVVDDESRMRKLVKDFLGREGYQVLEAGITTTPLWIRKRRATCAATVPPMPAVQFLPLHSVFDMHD